MALRWHFCLVPALLQLQDSRGSPVPPRPVTPRGSPYFEGPQRPRQGGTVTRLPAVPPGRGSEPPRRSSSIPGDALISSYPAPLPRTHHGTRSQRMADHGTGTGTGGRSGTGVYSPSERGGETSRWSPAALPVPSVLLRRQRPLPRRPETQRAAPPVPGTHMKTW